MSDKLYTESRRKLLKSIAAGSGAVVAGKNLPETWVRPVVDSVILPAHAETSASPVRSFRQQIVRSNTCTGELSETDVSAPDQQFNFSWGSQTPVGDGTLTVQVTGDVNGDDSGGDETWTIAFNGMALSPEVGNTDPSGDDTGDEPTTALHNFTIPLANILSAGGAVTVTATNNGYVDCFIQDLEPNVGQTVNSSFIVTLSFQVQ